MKKVLPILVLLLLLALAASALWNGRAGVAALLGFRHAAPPPSGPTVLDALNRHVPIPPASPSRILVSGKAPFTIRDTLMLFPSVRANAVLLGPPAQAQRENGAAVQAVLDEVWGFPPAPADSPQRLQTEGSAEDIAAASPDLILVKAASYLFGETLAPLDIPLAFLGLETPADYARDLALLGDLLHAPADAARINDAYATRIALVSNAVSAARATPGAPPPPRVLACQITPSRGVGTCRVPPPDWLQTWMVTAAGGIPIWTNNLLPGQWSNVTLEQVAAWDPDVLVVITYPTTARTGVELLATSTAWTALRCWQTSRVYPMPGDLCSWDLPDPRWILGLQWMATRLLPPSAFPPGYTLSSAVADFYALLGVPPDTTSARILPLIDEPLDVPTP